jgi:two-component system response regulator
LFREGKFTDCSEPASKLVLLDMKLPKLDGLQVLEEMRRDSRTLQLPAILMTDPLYFSGHQSARQFAATGYLSKPVSLPFLGKVLGTLGL